MYVGGEPDGLKNILVIGARAAIGANRQMDVLIHHLAHRHNPAAKLKIADRVMHDAATALAYQLNVARRNPNRVRQ